jgi:predicted CoA-binding protein
MHPDLMDYLQKPRAAIARRLQCCALRIEGALVKAAIDRSKVIHITILTRDISGSAGQWADFLQEKTPDVIITVAPDDANTPYLGKPCGRRLRRVAFDLDTIQTELLQPANDTPSIWKDALDRNGEGLHEHPSKQSEVPR